LTFDSLVAPRTAKVIKNLLKNGILHFVLGSANRQKSRQKVRI